MDKEITDEGQSAPTVNEDEEYFSSPQADVADETNQSESTDESVEDKESEGEEKVSEDSTDEQKEDEAKAEETTDELLAKIDNDIADEKHPAYYRNGLKLFKDTFIQKTEEIERTYEPLKDYGDVEKITGDLEIVKGLEAIEVNPTTGLPERTVKPAVDRLVERKGFETAFDVFLELGGLKTPDGDTLFDELLKVRGLDPDHINDYKTLKANGYHITGTVPPDPDELALIPESLREAYASMTPAEREKIAPTEYDDQTDISFRERTLKAIQHELDTERDRKANEQSEAERKAQEKIQEQQKFYQDVNTKTQELFTEYGAKLHTSFVDALTAAGLDELDAISTANTMSMILNSTGIEGTSSKTALEKIGVKLDPQIETLYGEWLQTGQAVATFDKQGDKANHTLAVNRFNELTEKLERKAKPVIAGIVEHRGKQLKSKVESDNTEVDKTQTSNNGIKPNEGRPNTVTNGHKIDQDFSEAAYASIDPFK